MREVLLVQVVLFEWSDYETELGTSSIYPCLLSKAMDKNKGLIEYSTPHLATDQERKPLNSKP